MNEDAQGILAAVELIRTRIVKYARDHHHGPFALIPIGFTVTMKKPECS